MEFYSQIKKNINKNKKKIIFIDYKKKWNWLEVSKKVDLFSKIIKPHLKDNQISVPIIISRRAELLISFIACLKLGISFTPVLKINEDSVFELANKINSNFYFDPIKKKIILNKKIKNKYRKSIKIKNKIYILFTSGSTGKPKGVICDNENIINTLLWSKKYLKWNKKDIIGNVTKFNFDISLFDFFSSIYFNVPLSIIKNPHNLDDTIKNIKNNKISSIFSTPSFFSQFVFNNSVIKIKNYSLKQIISGGDFFPMTHIKYWMDKNKKINIYNVWGPTETSIVNSMHLINKNDYKNINKFPSMSVGESTKRMEISIIKRKKIINEPNVNGFICLSGKSICKGFIDENYRYKKMLIKIKNKIYFNTGDIGYFNHKKQLFILGRLDNDIKIQGYRINQKEIEQIAEKYSNIFLCATFKKKITSEFSELHMLVQLKKTKKLDIFKFKNSLRQKLPFYKIPKKIILIKKIPLNSNGKLDRLNIDNKFN